jgi:hypothetical protein
MALVYSERSGVRARYLFSPPSQGSPLRGVAVVGTGAPGAGAASF